MPQRWPRLVTIRLRPMNRTAGGRPRRWSLNRNRPSRSAANGACAVRRDGRGRRTRLPASVAPGDRSDPGGGEERLLPEVRIRVPAVKATTGKVDIRDAPPDPLEQARA